MILVLSRALRVAPVCQTDVGTNTKHVYIHLGFLSCEDASRSAGADKIYRRSFFSPILIDIFCDHDYNIILPSLSTPLRFTLATRFPNL